MIIMKFGGTSVGSAESIRRVRDIVTSRAEQEPVVVVSAVSGVTDLLMELVRAEGELADNLLQKIHRRHQDVIDGLWEKDPHGLKQYVKSTLEQEYRNADRLNGNERSDRIVSLGEIISSRIVSKFIAEHCAAESVVATRLIVTDDSFGVAEVIDNATRALIAGARSQLTGRKTIPVVTGFIGATEDGRITTLGRGGSDYTAALLGYYLDAEEIQIWTDVDGVFSADPRQIPAACLVDEITYKEASELAAFGAKVLHPKTMRPAVHGNIPVRIANTFSPEAASTRIVASSQRSGKVIAVAAKKSVIMVNIYAAEMLLERGFLARICTVFAKHNISIDIISASETSVSVTLDNHGQLDSAIRELEEFSAVSVNDAVGLVSVIGQGISSRPELLAEVAARLADMNVKPEMVSVGAQGINISLVIAGGDVVRVADSLHQLCMKGES